MNNLLVVNQEDMENIKIDGRRLHMELGVNTPYTMWFERMTEYGFSEGTDFITKMLESTGGRPQTNHVLTLDMAKEIAMLQRSEKGKQIRQYFIQIEKEWNSPDKVMARALTIANRKLAEKNKNIELLCEKIENDKPKVIFAESVSGSNTCILVGQLAKLINQNGYNIGQNRLFAWLRENGYLNRDNTPSQYSSDRKWFEIKERTINNPDGSIRITKTTMVTGKGQIYFVNKFREMAK
jgi:anti-repressor protein